MKQHTSIRWWALPAFLACYVPAIALVGGYPLSGHENLGAFLFVLTMGVNLIFMVVEIVRHKSLGAGNDKRHLQASIAALIPFIIGGWAYWLVIGANQS